VAKPIVKWAGGKRRLLPALVAHVPRRMRTYVEPFAGGAALFFHLATSTSHVFERAVLADRNPELVALYRAVKADVEAVIAALSVLKARPDRRELFYSLREADTQRMTDVDRAARFVFLNRTGYNGLWRVNSRGVFNVPYGRYKDPKIVDADRLRAAARALARAELLHADFGDALRDLHRSDFVYFDPPYVPVSKTAAFTAYAREGFGPREQERLASVMRELKKRGVRALLSNAGTESARELYKGFRVEEVRAPRAINSVASKRGEVGELLVRNF
jgi:DNA adenine methylase